MLIGVRLSYCEGSQGGRAHVFQFLWDNGDTVVPPECRLRVRPYGCGVPASLVTCLE